MSRRNPRGVSISFSVTTLSFTEEDSPAEKVPACRQGETSNRFSMSIEKLPKNLYLGQQESFPFHYKTIAIPKL